MNSLLLLLFLISEPDDSLQCVCYPKSLNESFHSSDIILIGRVLKIDTAKLFDKELPKGTFREGNLARVEVRRMIKGALTSDTLSIMTGNGFADCGYVFKVNTNYLIYATKKDYILIDSTDYDRLQFVTTPRIILTTTNCDRTTPLIAKENKLLKKFLKGF